MNNVLIEIFGNTSRIKVLVFFLENPYDDYSIKEIVSYIGLSKPVVSREIKNLIESNLVMKSRRVGHTQMYTYKFNDITRKLDELLDSIISNHLEDGG